MSGTIDNLDAYAEAGAGADVAIIMMGGPFDLTAIEKLLS